MKPFTAWLAMGQIAPALFACAAGFRYEAFPDEATANRRTATGDPQRVLIIADTEENRKKLGIGV